MDRPLFELVAALKHDLGKYVAWRSANLSEEAWTGPVGPMLIECLQADLLRTRSGPQGDRAAWEVFDQHTESLARPLPEPELVAVQEAVQRLRAAESALRAGDPDGVAAVRDDVRAAQAAIRKGLADLHRRLLR